MVFHIEADIILFLIVDKLKRMSHQPATPINTEKGVSSEFSPKSGVSVNSLTVFRLLVLVQETAGL